jgi:hypothetical protein
MNQKFIYIQIAVCFCQDKKLFIIRNTDGKRVFKFVKTVIDGPHIILAQIDEFTTDTLSFSLTSSSSQVLAF